MILQTRQDLVDQSLGVLTHRGQNAQQHDALTIRAGPSQVVGAVIGLPDEGLVLTAFEPALVLEEFRLTLDGEVHAGLIRFLLQLLDITIHQIRDGPAGTAHRRRAPLDLGTHHPRIVEAGIAGGLVTVDPPQLPFGGDTQSYALPTKIVVGVSHGG